MKVFRTLKTAAADWLEDGATQLSAALAYYSLFSLAPLLLIAVAAASLFIDPEVLQRTIAQYLHQFVGDEGADMVESMMAAKRVEKSGLAGTAGIALLLFGASSVFGQLKTALNRVWEVEQKPGLGIKGFVRNNLVSFGLVFALGFILLISLAATTVVSEFTGALARSTGLGDVGWHVATFLAVFVTIALVVAVLFKFLPDVEIAWGNVWFGALVTALFFAAGKFALGAYLANAGSAYGAAGSVVVVLLWLYYSSLIFLFGAEVTQAWARETGSRIRPSDHAAPIDQKDPPARKIDYHAAGSSPGSDKPGRPRS